MPDEVLERDRELLEKLAVWVTNPPLPPKKKLLDLNINVQSLVIALLGVIVAMAVWGVGALVDYQSKQAVAQTFRETSQAQMQVLEKDIQSLNDQLNIMRQGTVQLREALAKWQQDDAVTNAEQQRQIAALDKSLALLQEKFDIERQQMRPPSPHGEIEIPDKFGSLKGDSTLASGSGEVPQLSSTVSPFKDDHP